MSTVCFYHRNCFDGACAAWIIKQEYPNAEFVAAQYGDSFPFHEYGKDDDIIIVDFSFPRDIMEAIKDQCRSILVLDHHKTAQANCEGLSYCIFDMNKSGASLTWNHYFPDDPIPRLVKYIADRDLWRFNEPDSEDINAFIQSYPIDYNAYDTIDYLLENRFDQCLDEGKAITRYKQSMVKMICSNYVIKTIAGYKAAVVNCAVLMSEVGHELALIKGVDFGAYYFDRADGNRQWGARSIGDFDVSEIAKQFGGGGHKNAAGWQETISQ